MTENTEIASKRKLWVRGFFMLLMCLIWQVAGTVLFVVTILQFVLAVLSDAPNGRLIELGRSLGQYLHQIASFLTFASEDVPFPFSEWPAGQS